MDTRQVIHKIITENHSDSSVSFFYAHNKEKSPYLGSRFGQDIEPAGMYVISVSDKNLNKLPNYEYGHATLVNPLIIQTFSPDGKYDWKNRLSSMYEGKTGKDLSNILLHDGYDGIITMDNGEMSEIVIFNPDKSITETDPSNTSRPNGSI